MISSAGLAARGGTPFRGRDADYRAIPADTKPEDLLISHISINFDHDRLGGGDPYSLMGATDPVQIEPHARKLTGRLKADVADAVILPPV